MRKIIVAVALMLATLGALAPSPASAGVGYWSYGCRAGVQWFEYANQTSFKTWYYNDGSRQYTSVQYQLRGLWKWAGSECGAMVSLAGNEYQASPGVWEQKAVGGWLHWDANNCNNSWVTFNYQYGQVHRGFCWIPH